MGRLEKQLDPHTGPLTQFAADLRTLRRTAGSPTYRELSRTAGYSPSALSAAANGAKLPSPSVLAAYVKACGGDIEAWLARRTEVDLALAAPAEAVTLSPPPARRRGPRRLSLRQRFAGLTAAALVGSLVTILPMAIWGAPACLTHDGSHPAPVATSSCPAGER